jgi:hypothetical protein
VSLANLHNASRLSVVGTRSYRVLPTETQYGTVAHYSQSHAQRRNACNALTKIEGLFDE